MEKKSLLNNLKATKKANVIATAAKKEETSTRKMQAARLRRTKMAEYK